jgi:Uma2 family endonuclease
MTASPSLWTSYNLYSDEPPMEAHRHLLQILRLLADLRWHWRAIPDYFASGNLTIYYNPDRLKNRDFRGPDFFVVRRCDPNPNRLSWVVWTEGRYPDFILEILSESTAKVDRTTKKRLYQDTFRTPEYFLIEPETPTVEGYGLQDGVYEAIAPNAEGRVWSEVLELYLGVWGNQVRFFTAEGCLVMSPEETALAAEQGRIAAQRQQLLLQERVAQERQQREQAQQQAAQERQQREQAQQQAAQERQQREQAQQQAAQERQRAEQLAAQLRALGIDPDRV